MHIVLFRMGKQRALLEEHCTRTVDVHAFLELRHERGGALLHHCLDGHALLQVLDEALQERAEMLCAPDITWHLRTDRRSPDICD